MPVLGSDFLTNYGLILDFKNRLLIDPSSTTNEMKQNTMTLVAANIASGINKDNRYVQILKEFPSILRETINPLTTKHDVRHSITTTGLPVRSKVHRLPQMKYTAAKEQFFQTLETRYYLTIYKEYGLSIEGKCFTELPSSETKRQLRAYLGMYTFYQKCLPHCANILAPLHKMCSHYSNKYQKITWTKEHDEAFEKSKNALSDFALLNHPDPEAEISLAVDASGDSIGSVLQQKRNNQWEPLGFFLKIG
uniref:uncharacterized protein LOC120347886 n=1 Tax=Styela clava TaxID=7725 RepID=UPI00193993E3|nr:uncharacterized protein LOC120347886 [Styela clava]